MNRRTSAYTLRVAAPGENLPEALEAVVASLPEGVGVTDKHYLSEFEGAYVSVTFRTSGDEEAVAVAERVLTLRDDTEAVLMTGLGVHRRVVDSWTPEQAQ